MELIILCIVAGATLVGWGIGWDVPAATLAGAALLGLGLLANLGLRLRPALVASVAAVTVVLAMVVTLGRTGPAGEAPTAAAPAATAMAGTPGPAAAATPQAGEDPVAFGRRLATTNGCVACHTTDGRAATGPTWRGLFGKTERLQGGGTVVVDDAYLRESIVSPNAKIVQGFTPTMPQFRLSEAEVDALIAHIKSLR